MKRYLNVVAIIVIALFGCASNPEVVEKSDDGSTTLVEEALDPLEDFPALEVYLHEKGALYGFDLESTYDYYYCDLNGIEDDEILIVNREGGETALINVDSEGRYNFIHSKLKVKKNTTLEFGHQMIQVIATSVKPAVSENSMKVYGLKNDELVMLINEIMTLNKVSVIDALLETKDVLETDIEYLDNRDFIINVTRAYVDEFGEKHDYQYQVKTIRYDAETGNYYASETVEGLKNYQAVVEQGRSYGEESLQAFEEVYKDSGLEGAVDYYSDHRLSFDEEASRAYANAVVRKLISIYERYHGKSKDKIGWAYDLKETEVGLEVLFERTEVMLDKDDQSLFAYFLEHTYSDQGLKAIGPVIKFKDYETTVRLHKVVLDSDHQDLLKDFQIFYINTPSQEAVKESFVDRNSLVIDRISHLNEDNLEHEERVTIYEKLINNMEAVDYMDAKDLIQFEVYSGYESVRNYLNKADAYYLDFECDIPVTGKMQYHEAADSYEVLLDTLPVIHVVHTVEGIERRLDLPGYRNFFRSYGDEKPLFETLHDSYLERMKAGEQLPFTARLTATAGGYNEFGFTTYNVYLEKFKFVE